MASVKASIIYLVQLNTFAQAVAGCSAPAAVQALVGPLAQNHVHTSGGEVLVEEVRDGSPASGPVSLDHDAKWKTAVAAAAAIALIRALFRDIQDTTTH